MRKNIKENHLQPLVMDIPETDHKFCDKRDGYTKDSNMLVILKEFIYIVGFLVLLEV